MIRSVCVAMLLLLSLTVVSASAQTVNVTIGKDLPDGMTVFVTVGGDGANCSGSGSGKVSGGSVTISFDMHCEPSGRPPSSLPNDKCRVFARALDEKPNTEYKGNGKLTPTSVSGVYQSRFRLTVVPPKP